MGFEKNCAGLFLKIRADGVKLGRVLTLGHQNVHMSITEYCRALDRLGRTRVKTVPEFVDELLLNMGATAVDSVDFSDYEGARLTHDLNQPIPDNWHQSYDLVFDGGTLEHVFHFPTAIKSCMQMIKPGGRFVTITEPNNWCGHGFYQFSPELFFRVLSPSNGFSVVEMYIATLDGRAYSVKDPEVVRSRVELCNDEPVFLLVHARRDTICSIFEQTPQQSDYVADWASGVSKRAPLSRWKMYPGILQLRKLRQVLLKPVRERQRRQDTSLSNTKLYSPVDLSF